MRRSPSVTFRRRSLVWLPLVGAVLCLALGVPPATRAAEGLTMEARVLLDGHARTGSWMAIEVHVVNNGPAIAGELRLAGGSQGQTRFGTAADLPTTSDKTFRLYAQPPAFGRDLTITLAEGDVAIATTKATFVLHDPSQLVVGIVAERPGEIIGSLDLLPNQNNVAPLTVALDPEDLPERLEAWGTLDRLVWQDLDSARLSTGQLEALRGWIAGGGRLVIVGGTAGPAGLSAFPDQILPYRPTATTEVSATVLASLLGEVPANTPDVPALSGDPGNGHVLALAGDRIVAAELAYGSGAATIVGFDPTVSWVAKSDLAASLWRRLLPTRTVSGPVIGDDSQIVAATSQLPSLALPPIGGLILLLGGYILFIGPINYLVLRRLDRREWAWLTMPALIIAFALGAYGFGSALRGSEVIINEVAIVRGAPGTTEGSAQAYLGVFSPSRGTYQLQVPGGALLSSPINGEFFGGDGTAAALDVLQDDPARVRDLTVGFGSLRIVRADSAVAVPLVKADLRLEAGRLKGTVTNASSQVLLQPAVVLGSTVASLEDLPPGASAAVDVALQPALMGQPISDRVVGQLFFDGSEIGEEGARKSARHTIVDQLTYDPNSGFTGQLPSDGAVILAWSDQSLMPIEISGQVPKRTGNILYFLPAELAVRGRTTFGNDLLRSTVISADSAEISKDTSNLYFGKGSVELSYRPIAFQGTIEATQLTIGLNAGEGPGLIAKPTMVKPLDSTKPSCGDAPGGCQGNVDGLPEVEFYDLISSAWRQLPHLGSGIQYALEEPQRYVDGASGTVRVRFVNDRSEGVGFQLNLAITGDLN